MSNSSRDHTFPLKRARVGEYRSVNNFDFPYQQTESRDSAASSRISWTTMTFLGVGASDNNVRFLPDYFRSRYSA
jgi:hypothetical protein